MAIVFELLDLWKLCGLSRILMIQEVFQNEILSVFLKCISNIKLKENYFRNSPSHKTTIRKLWKSSQRHCKDVKMLWRISALQHYQVSSNDIVKRKLISSRQRNIKEIKKAKQIKRVWKTLENCGKLIEYHVKLRPKIENS